MTSTSTIMDKSVCLHDKSGKLSNLLQQGAEARRTIKSGNRSSSSLHCARLRQAAHVKWIWNEYEMCKSMLTKPSRLHITGLDALSKVFSILRISEHLHFGAKVLRLWLRQAWAPELPRSGYLFIIVFWCTGQWSTSYMLSRWVSWNWFLTCKCMLIPGLFVWSIKTSRLIQRLQDFLEDILGQNQPLGGRKTERGEYANANLVYYRN